MAAGGWEKAVASPRGTESQTATGEAGTLAWTDVRGWEMEQRARLSGGAWRTPLLSKGQEMSGERDTIVTEKLHVSILCWPELMSQNEAPGGNGDSTMLPQ